MVETRQDRLVIDVQLLVIIGAQYLTWGLRMSFRGIHEWSEIVSKILCMSIHFMYVTPVTESIAFNRFTKSARKD